MDWVWVWTSWDGIICCQFLFSLPLVSPFLMKMKFCQVYFRQLPAFQSKAGLQAYISEKGKILYLLIIHWDPLEGNNWHSLLLPLFKVGEINLDVFVSNNQAREWERIEATSSLFLSFPKYFKLETDWNWPVNRFCLRNNFLKKNCFLPCKQSFYQFCVLLFTVELLLYFKINRRLNRTWRYIHND